MKLKDIKTLTEVAKESGKDRTTLFYRLTLPGFDMVEGEDYRRLGPRLPVLLSPEGVKKILKEPYQNT